MPARVRLDLRGTFLAFESIGGQLRLAARLYP